MVTRLDPYLVLGVSTSSEDVVIRAAFKALMLKYHPDTNNSPGATTRTACINEAFSILGDPIRRAAYDASRDQPITRHYSKPSPSPFSSVPERSLKISNLTMLALIKTAEGRWLSLGGSTIAILFAGAMMLMEIRDVKGASFLQITMNSLYTTDDNQIDTNMPLLEFPSNNMLITDSNNSFTDNIIPTSNNYDEFSKISALTDRIYIAKYRRSNRITI